MAKKKSFPLRLDENMYDALRRWAEAEFRSVNGQIEYVLSEALRKAGRKVGKGGKQEGGKR
jgi:hypothetical protein